MRQDKLPTERLALMYIEQHLTLRQIGKLVRMSPTAVMKRLRKVGVGSADGEWVDCNCVFCGKFFRSTRSRWRRSSKHFCTDECYYAYRENPDYNAWRQGSRIARGVVSQYFRLEPSHIVHHKDFNQRNNNLDNLAVYATSSDHMRMHHGGKVEPLWDGAGPATLS